MATATMEQPGFQFPVSLTEKYRPSEIENFVGLEKIKNAMRRIIAAPRPCNLLFIGESGLGKTAMALALARSINAELHHVTAQECDVDTLRRLYQQTHYVPRAGLNFLHVILADELDRASYAAQMYLLSKLDGTEPFPNTIFIGTTNDASNLEPRFLSRFLKLEFSNYGIQTPASELLQRVWFAEGGTTVNAPNFARIVKENNGNIRGALMDLDKALLTA